MTKPTMLAYKGPRSQTGLAASAEFPGVNFSGDSETFDEIADALENSNMVAVLPMWNSHEGEVLKSRAIQLLFDGHARLYKLWPKAIEFQCVVRVDTPGSPIDKMISVHVANTQCSKFIAEKKASFEGHPSTVDAYKAFSSDTTIDAVLCAPGQNTNDFPVLMENAANPVNFTTFALLACIKSEEWVEMDWDSLYPAITPPKRAYAGVLMPIQVAPSEDQEQLLKDLTDNAVSINDLPNILFVTERPDGMCGLIIEGDIGFADTNVIVEDGYSVEVSVIPDIGSSSTQYRERTHDFFEDNFQVLNTGEFIRHIGTETCLFACPPLGMITHGFDANVVEPVFRKIISKSFELYDNGLKCTNLQEEFFNKHLNDYYDKGVDFFIFNDVGLE